MTQRLVYVVDDEELIASTLGAILRLEGYKVRVFFHSREALIACRSESPDLLISDVMMPELTGVELAILVQEQCFACEIVLFSGQAATTDLLQTARQQGRSFTLLPKPIHPLQLLSELARLHSSKAIVDG